MKINPAPRYTQLSDKRIIKLLQRISQTIGLSVPDLYNYNGLAVWYIIYSILICLLLLGLCVYTLYCKCLYFYFDIIATVAILDSIAITSITLTNVISVLFTVIVRRRKIVQVVKHLKEIERTLNEKFDIVCQLNDRGLFLEFISLEIMIAAYVIFDSISEIKGNDVFHYSWTVVMHLNIIMVSVSVMQVQIVSTCIKQYFRVVNERLGATMQYPVWRKGEKSSNPKFGTVNMKFFLKLYDKLCDVIELTSKSHGIQIACISFIIIICLIESMNILMKFALRIAVMGGKSNINLLLADTWNSIIYIIFGIILAICCEQASSEANNTSIICYKILLDYPSVPKSRYEEVTKNELMLLAEHLSQRKVKFSAAGLFTIDHTMLYMIFGSIAAYLVIVLQFK